jgi:hypothetical protein
MITTLFFNLPRSVSDWASLPFFVRQATTRWDQRLVLLELVTAKRLVFMAARAGASTLFFHPSRGVADWAALPFFVKQAITRWDQRRVLLELVTANRLVFMAPRPWAGQARQLSSSIRHAALLIGQHFFSSSSRPPHAGTGQQRVQLELVTAKRLVSQQKAGVGHGQGRRVNSLLRSSSPPRGVADWAALPIFVE